MPWLNVYCTLPKVSDIHIKFHCGVEENYFKRRIYQRCRGVRQALSACTILFKKEEGNSTFFVEKLERPFLTGPLYVEQ